MQNWHRLSSRVESRLIPDWPCNFAPVSECVALILQLSFWWVRCQ